jgi:D-3-phosphoglycerate dehydrogenase / 2-oxoglutarate reductase
VKKYHILVLNQIASIGLDRLPADHFDLAKSISHPDAILLRSYDMHAMDVPASVKVVGRAGAGTNNIPIDKMSARGIPVMNAPGANANAVKELVLAGLLLAARNLVPAIRYVDALDKAAPDLEAKVEEGKKQFAGSELPGKTLGIIGLGAIGSLVADTAIKLGMKVIGFDPHITVDAAWRLPASVKKADSVEDVLKQSDFVSLHIPLVDATRGLINVERLALLKPEAVLLNFSRDGIVNEDAVLAALTQKKLRYYICDFPAAKFIGHPGVVALPHLGASTAEAEDNCAIMVVDQVREFLEHGTIANAVNFPYVEMARESPYRVAIANANVPNMLGQISTAMANAKLNIHNMINKSRGDMAYTLVDVDSPASDEVVARIAAINGVLSVRAIPLPNENKR